MAEAYVSLAQSAESRLEIKKSIFIGNAVSVSTQKDAEDFIASIRKKHPDARHCCFAYLIRNGGISRISDDGEPQGTAGLPMLEIIKKSGVCDVAVTVTRYFGGILLGASGLCRAYGAACAEAIRLGGAVEFTEYDLLECVCDYGDFPKIEYEIKKAGFPAAAPVFSDRVTISFMCKCENTEKISRLICDISSSRAKTVAVKKLFAPRDAENMPAGY